MRGGDGDVSRRLFHTPFSLPPHHTQQYVEEKVREAERQRVRAEEKRKEEERQQKQQEEEDQQGRKRAADEAAKRRKKEAAMEAELERLAHLHSLLARQHAALQVAEHDGKIEK